MKSLRIFIAEDSKSISDVLSKALKERLEIEKIGTAEDFEEVKGNISEFDPMVMIIDVHLKKGTGFDVLQLIKERNLRPLIIVLTNYALDPYKDRAFQLGANYFFDKSSELNKVIGVIENYALQSS